ncbi:MAG: hypothetical protein KF734_08020 [Saprospiraceae bacterium]|nr:hypothetical protein [Saprospiraceae bacterium]
MKNTFCYAASLLFALFTFTEMRAQLVYTDPYGYTYTISSDKGGVCDAPNGASFPVFSYDNPALQSTFDQVSPGHYFKAKFGEPVTITVEVRNPFGIPSYTVAPFKALIGTDSPPYLYDLDNIEGSGLENEYDQNNQLVAYRYKHTFYFGRADTKTMFKNFWLVRWG